MNLGKFRQQFFLNEGNKVINNENAFYHVPLSIAQKCGYVYKCTRHV